MQCRKEKSDRQEFFEILRQDEPPEGWRRENKYLVLIFKLITIMTKKNFKKSNARVGKKNGRNNQSREEALLMLDKGGEFGNGIISMMAMFAYDFKGMGIAAIGLAKALAALKDISRQVGVDIDKLYDSELAYFKSFFEELPDLEED